MKTGKHRLIPLLLLLPMALAFALCACGSEEEEDAAGGGVDVAEYQEYADAADETMSDEQIRQSAELASKAAEMNKEEDNFYGTWKATSQHAVDLYGHLEITINRNGTFDADVTDEIFSGTWKKIEGGISYTSELMEGKIFYGKTCRMVIENDGESVTMKKVSD